ncbi:MAG: hypothetical protein WA733_19125 [Methylocystis sp.]|jgi:hypothetical protein
MSKIRKIITTGLIATTLATAVVASTPASAWYRRYGGYYGGGWGWGGAPAIAAIGLGALAVGAVAAGAGAYPYYGGYGYPAAYGYAYPARLCVTRSPVYDDWGNFVGYQRMRVAC